MSQKREDIFVQADNQTKTVTEPFRQDFVLQPTDKELFTGDFSFLKDLKPKTEKLPDTVKIAKKGGNGFIYAFLVGNIIVTLIVAGILWHRPAQAIEPIQTNTPPPEQPKTSSAENPTQAEQIAAVKPDDAVSTILSQAPISNELHELANQGFSMKTGDDFFANKNYLEALYVYRQIHQNQTASTSEAEYLKDYLKLRMAVCLQRAGQEQAQQNYFSDVLESRCPYVRGLANYYMAILNLQNKNYLESRKRAYQVLGLLKSFEGAVSANLEADMYFLAGEALSRYTLSVLNVEYEMPGRLWSENLPDIWPTGVSNQELEGILLHSGQLLSEAAAGPQVRQDSNRSNGSQWTLISLSGPLEEIMWKISARPEMDVEWQTQSQIVRSRPLTLYLNEVSQQYLAEVVCGSAGLIWRFDGQKGLIGDPETYDSHEVYRNSLNQESISMLQRFLLRYRGDHRNPNAHYLLGQMYSMNGQDATSLGEFKLIGDHFPHNPLAPYAFFEASKIKIRLKDFQGARADLHEMLMLYPDCKMIDEATLYLAEATLESGQLDLAANLYNRAYQISITEERKFRSALGAGRSAFLQKDWSNTKKWLTKTLELLPDKKDPRIGKICCMLGNACIELGDLKEASRILRSSLKSDLLDNEYVQIVLDLARSEISQQNFVEAMNILENVPVSRLNQRDTCALLIMKSQVFREIGFPDSGISLIHRKIEYITDSQLRAWLTLEMAICYYETGDYTVAQRELNEVAGDMQDAVKAQQAGLLLAQISEKRGRLEQTESLCRTLLDNPNLEKDIRTKTCELLGRVYTNQKQYEKAALTFAGVDFKDKPIQ